MLGTINIWLLIGIVFAVVFTLWQVQVHSKVLGQFNMLIQTLILGIDDTLAKRDEEVGQRIEGLESKLEALYEHTSKKEETKLS